MVNQRSKDVSETSDAVRGMLRLLQCHATAEHRYRDAIARVLDITMSEATAIGYLLAGGLSPDELAHELDLSPGGTIALIQRLENRGYAARVASRGEIPRLMLNPTTPLEEGRVSMLRDVADLLHGLSPGKRSAMATFLDEATIVAADAAASLAACYRQRSRD
jgi:DNA-binding MarR family transcriptional regulator